MKLEEKDIRSLYEQILKFQDNKILFTTTCCLIHCKFQDMTLYLDAVVLILKKLIADGYHTKLGTGKWEIEVAVDYIEPDYKGFARDYLYAKLKNN